MIEEGSGRWMPPKHLSNSSSSKIEIRKNYPVNYTNSNNNTIYSISLINTTRQNYIPNINYKEILNNTTVSEIELILNTLDI